MNRKVPFVSGEFYHIYNRGTDKRDIFTNEHDYRRFLTLLYLCNSDQSVDIDKKLREGRTFPELIGVERGETLVSIGAYCLMPNHFHILLIEQRAGGISCFMKKLSTAYSMYFNKKYGRTGALFEGKFKAKHANTDEYLKYLFSYIHLNPVKILQPDWKDHGINNLAAAKEHLRAFPYSSYLDYIEGGRRESSLLNKTPFPDYFKDQNSFDQFIDDWITYRELI